MAVLRSRISTVAADLQSAAFYAQSQLPISELYRLLKAFYLNNGLYDEIYDVLVSVGEEEESLRPLRNPAYRVVEFYAAKMWPEPLPNALKVKTTNERIIVPIQQVWSWSNWTSMKQRLVRQLAIYGESFIKIVSPKDSQQVYYQVIDPTYAPDLTLDGRDFLTYIRFDIPRQERRDDDELEDWIFTEVWDKSDETLRMWKHQKGTGVDTHALGEPDRQTTFQADADIDFIPIVHVKLKDIGDDRGLGAFTQSLDKIHEANRMATRLHQMLWRYRSPIWALEANQSDSMGRPMPAPTFDKNTDSEVELGDDKLLRIPGNATLKALIPNVSWGDVITVLQDHMQEMEHDMPELAYWRLRDQGELSGRAVQLLLGDAVDKIVEARGNAFSGLIRANQMALTIGANKKLDGFSGLGDFESGALYHTLIAREIIPTPEMEKAQAAQTWQLGQVSKDGSLERVGWTDDELEIESERKEEQDDAAAERQEALLATQTVAAERRLNRGNDQPANTNVKS